MKMDYQKPVFELVKLEAEDIITLSKDEWGGGDVEDLTGAARGWTD